MPLRSSPDKSVLRVTGLCKNFGEVEVLHDLSLTIGAGKRVALMGRSGSGKSTLLNCICGIEQFHAGSIEICGELVNNMKFNRIEQFRRERLGYVFQSFHLLPTLTALENVEFPAQLIHSSRDDIRNRARELLRLVGMEHRETHRPDALSGGELQRIALARAVINHPRLILADEPTGSLDHTTAKEVFNVLYNLKDKNRLIIYATHNRFFANMADCKLEMIDGNIKTINARIK